MSGGSWGWPERRGRAMWRRPELLWLAVLCAVLATPARAAASATALPDTPAGQVLGDFLDALNGADDAQRESFIRAYPSCGMTLDEMKRWRADTGGYDLLELYSNDRTNVFFRMKARTNGSEEIGRVQVTGTTSTEIVALGAWRVPAGARFEPITLDDAARGRVIESAANTFERSYVDPPIGKLMAADLRRRAARGEYRTMLYGDAFASSLTRQLREISHDKHLEVRFSYGVPPAESAADRAAADAKRLAADNCGFTRAEHLQPNIGYLKFDQFADLATCASTAGAAMTFLADSDALIIDLRENHGGAPAMVEFIATYLLDRRTHLDDIFNRDDNATTQEWTLPYVPGRKFIGKPVFVLTSKGTFSAAEALSSWLKNLKRATLVGETTSGGAHPTDLRRIDDHFSVRVPYARSVNPITGANWEGTGVEPDVKVAAAQALEVALDLAAKEIGRDGPNPAAAP
jgi:hypothetical protein